MIATSQSPTVATAELPHCDAPRWALWRRRPALWKAGLSIFDQAVYSGTSFLTAVIVGRSLSTSDLGVYYLTLTIVMVTFGIHENVVAGPYMIYSARKRGYDLDVYTGSMWAHHSLLTLLTIGAIGIMLLTSLTSGSGAFNAGLETLLVAGPMMLLREGIRRLCFARLQQAAAIVLDSAVSMLQLGGLATLWYLDRITAANVFAVMGGACAVASLGWVAIAAESFRVVPARVVADGRHNWNFAQWALLSWLTVDTVPFVMPWIVDFAAGKSATGMYGACGTLVGVTNILVVGVGNFLRPKAAHSYAAGGTKSLRHVLLVAGAIFALMFGLFTLSMALAGNTLATFVYGDAFNGTWGILTALAANVLAGSLGFIAASGLWAIGRPRAGMLADVCLAVTTIIAAVILVPRYGAWGAAWAAVIGSTVGMALKVVTLQWLMTSLGDAIPLQAEEPARVSTESRLVRRAASLDPTRKRLTVSVIVPTYNRSDLLIEALDSALRQTRVPDEIIVVDDGSTDDTPEVLARYGAPVVSIRQANRGVSAARNLAMEKATGDILLFLDSDDLLLPRCVEACAEVFETMPEVDVVYSNLEIIDAEGKQLGIYSEVERGPRPSGDLLGELGCHCLTNLTSGALRRSVLGNVRFDESLPCAQDYEFWCQLAARCHFHYIDELLSGYRYHGSQVTTLRVGKMLEEAIEIQRRVMNMPEFARVSQRDRARVFATHGVKHALCRRTSAARHFFWKSLRTDSRYVTGAALLIFSLGGGPFLRWCITARRRLAGNYVEERAIRSASMSAAAQQAKGVSVAAAGKLAGAASTSASQGGLR